MNMKLIIRTFLICVFLVVNSAHLLAGEDSGQNPAPVPIELAKFVALYHAKQFYGDMGDLALYDSEVYYDLKGNPAVYAIVLVSSEVTPPSHEQLNTKIGSRYSDIESFRQEITAIENQSISGKAKSQKIQNIRAQIIEATKDLTGTETFVTVICGANESCVPVLKLFKGLPKHLTQAPLLLNKPGVKDVVRGETVRRTFFLGMFDLAFEFGAYKSQRSLTIDKDIEGQLRPDMVLIHSRTGKIVKLSDLRTVIEQQKNKIEAATKSRRQIESRTTNSLQQKWDRLKNRYNQYLRERETAQ